MASVNRVILVGNLGRDPETRTFPSGDQLTTINVATTDRWRDRNTGENREATEWHKVVFNGRLAEVAAQYLRKGSQVYIEGSLRTRKWTDQATGQDRYATEIRADIMQLLGNRQQGQQQAGDEGYGDYEPPQRQQRQPANNQQRQQGNGYQNGRNGSAPPPQRGASGFDGMGDDAPY